MAHRRARLTVFGRQLLVERIEVDGMSVALAAEMAGISRQTASKWLRRHREAPGTGLEDRSSRPRSSPRASPPELVAAILAERHLTRYGPHRLAPRLGIPRSTIGDVLRREGRSRLADLDGPTGAPVRYVRERPGELVHMDVKKLGRIPDGGGHRFLGRDGTPHSRAGYDFVHSAIDDCSRVAYSEIHPDEQGVTCAGFLSRAAAFFASLGVRIERVMTDNARNYVDSHAFQAVLVDIGASHRRTRAYRPQTNGKAERFNGTLIREWAYVRLYMSNEDRAVALPGFLDHYNHRRHHSALGGLTPMAFLVNNLSVNHS
jgi:transposase InsO family protein